MFNSYEQILPLNTEVLLITTPALYLPPVNISIVSDKKWSQDIKQTADHVLVRKLQVALRIDHIRVLLY